MNKTNARTVYKLSLYFVCSLMLLAVFSPVIAAQTLSATPQFGAVVGLTKSMHGISPMYTGYTDNNWAGYMVGGPSQSVTQVTMSYKIPAITGANGAYCGIWAGIDATGTDLQQIGTVSEMQNGKAIYYAFYEYLPYGPVTIPNFNVYPGDTIIASVYYISSAGGGNANIQVNIYDTTQGDEYFTHTQATTNGWGGNTGEWILETPQVGSSFAPLANFGTEYNGQYYTNCIPSCEAVISGTGGYIGSFGSNVCSLTMIATAYPYATMAAPSALSSDGSSFTVTWENAGP
jgi:hypothetical protein